MTAKEYQYWVNRLAQYDPRDNAEGSPRDKAYSEMIRVGIPLKDRVAINKAARKLFEERKPRPVGKVPELAMGYCGQRIESIWVDEAAPVDLRPGKMHWIDEAADWPTEYKCDLIRYGRSPAMSAMPDIDMVRSLHRTLFNTEGEKQMEKIDWSKPIRGAVTGDKYEVMGKATIVGEHGQSVMILDDYGRQVGNPRIATNNPQVENTPKEEFLVGLARDPDGTYWLTDVGVPTSMRVLDMWKQFMGDQPHWIVDTRKPAEPPKAIEYDPKDYVTIYMRQGEVFTSPLMTKRVAEAYASEPGEQVVRVRTTPPPADTARYIQLWRMKESDSWMINKSGPSTGNRQEFTWAETKNRETGPTRCAIKVRD